MAKWGFWDWVAYLCLGIAAFGLAAGAALKEEPAMFGQLPAFFTSPRWAYVPIILFAIGSVILAVRFGAPLLFGLPSSIAGSTSDRIFVQETPEYFFELVKDHTAVQRQKITEIYIGKWLKVSGSVRNVQAVSYPQRMVVTISIEGIRGISLWFNARWSDRIGLLRIGQNISAIGQISEIGGIDIDLQNCELTEPISSSSSQ